MFSFEAISANNGWAMALAGALIVMIGLAVLSLVISQFHKLVGFIEKTDKDKATLPEIVTPESPVPVQTIEPDPTNVDGIAEIYKSAAVNFGSEFQLTQLFEVAAKEQLPHPHLSIRSMRAAGIIVPVGDGRFTWR